MTIEEVVAREAIRQTLVNYTMAGDRADAETFVAQFAEDAIFEASSAPGVPAFRLEGIDAIRRYATDRMKHPRTSFVAHNLTTCQIRLTDEDTADVITYFVTFKDTGPDHAGVYIDKVKRVDDRWLFAHRQVCAGWLSPNWHNR